MVTVFITADVRAAICYRLAANPYDYLGMEYDEILEAVRQQARELDPIADYDEGDLESFARQIHDAITN